MRKIIILLTISLLPTSVYADNSSYYIGFGYGVAHYENGVKRRTEFAEIYAGYHFNKYFSFELAYADFKLIKGHYIINEYIHGWAFDSLYNKRESIDIYRISLSTIFEYPVYNKLNAFGALGYSYFNSERNTWRHCRNLTWGDDAPCYFGFSGGELETASGSEYKMFYGLGIKYNITDRTAARFQWAISNPSTMKIKDIRFSLEVIF